jgi:hypothetical protein
MLFSKTRHLDGEGLFEPQGLGLTISLYRGRIAFVRKSVEAVLLVPLESTAPLDGGGRGARHGRRDQSELDVVEARLFAAPVGDGVVNLGVRTVNRVCSPTNWVSEEVGMLIVVPFSVAVQRGGEDTVDIVEDLAEGLDDSVGLHVAIVFREGEQIQVVGGPSLVVERKEGVDFLEVDKGARYLVSGWDSMPDSKPFAIIDRDRVSVDLATQFDADSCWIAGGAVIEVVIHVVETGTVDPPPCLNFFKPATKHRSEGNSSKR